MGWWGAKAGHGVPPGKAQVKRHVWAVFLGVAAVLAGAAALATGTGEAGSPAEEPDDAVLLGEEDLADRAEILRNMYRRITPPDIPLVQDVGTWPAGWEEFGANWNAAAADREYGAWVLPVEVSQDAGLTVVKDGAGTVLWRGWTDFARPESAGVVLTGGLVAEEEWAVYEGIREAVERFETAGGTPVPPVRTDEPSGLRFTGHEWTADGNFRLELAYETDTNVDIFAYAVLHASNVVQVTWTNDENVAVTNTCTNWYSVGPPLEGKTNAWEWRGTVSISNGVAEFEDGGFPDTLSRQRFYAAAVAEDTDGDGLNDGMEVFVYHTDLTVADTDGDGLDDGEECFVWHTDPTRADSDGDGVPDGLDTMPATSNVWFEVVHSKTNYFFQELGWVENNAPEVPFNDWSWIVSDQPPTSDSVLEDVRVSGYADDYITIDSHPINHTRGPYTYNNWHVINQINNLESLQFTMRLVDWPDANYAGSNVVCVGLSDAEPFEVEWEWKVPMALTGPEYVCVGDAAQFEAGGAGGGPYTWSVSYEGTTPVAEIDEYGMLTALAPGIATVTVTAGEVYSVSQAVTVVQIDFLAGGGNTPASELKIGKWENAFTMIGTTANLKDNFIDLDPDRFRIRVQDFSKTGEGTVAVALSTAYWWGVTDDDATAIDLVEQPEDSGIFISTNLLLVADDIDDDFSSGHIPADDARNDRTHRATVRGSAHVRYPETGAAMATKEVVLNRDGTVHVIPVILRDVAQTNGGNAVVPEWKVDGYMEIAKRRYAQVGIDLTWDYPVVCDPPAGVDLADGLLVRTNQLDTLLASESKTLIEELGTAGNTNDIHLFFVNLVMIDDRGKVGSSVAKYWYEAPSEQGYSFNMFVRTGLDDEVEGCAVAHELGHLLTNRDHNTNDTWRLMYPWLLSVSDVEGTRRFVSTEKLLIQGDSHVH